MKFTEEMINEDEKRWHTRDIVTELGYCGNYMRDRKDMKNIDIRFYAYIMRKAHYRLKEQEAKGQIVQCKDCKYGCLWNGRDIVYCNKNIGTIESSVHKPNWFCADGEWKRNGNDVTS